MSVPTEFEQDLERRLEELRAQGLYRQLRRVETPQGRHIRVGPSQLLNFSSNDYLGLANHPALKQAAAEAIHCYGSGAGASRLISGSLTPHHQLDEAIAAFKGTRAALGFSTGYAAALGTICALVGKDDLIIIDKLVHASIVDAARLCGAKLRVFRHNDLADLERILIWARRTFLNAQTRALIVTESVFSMDGDYAPLAELVRLKEHYGAWLMVDEAHATGLYGLRRSGLAEALGVSHAIEVQMGTLGKSIGASGGYICGSRPLIDYLVNRARSFIFSTAPVPAAAAAARAGIELIQSNEGMERCARVWQRVSAAHCEFKLQSQTCRSAIFPIMIGSESRAFSVAEAFQHAGLLVPAIRYPTVPRGRARLRVTFTAEHRPEDILHLSRAFAAITQTEAVPA
jgi:8-amino-7-oxononanoate synthase